MKDIDQFSISKKKDFNEAAVRAAFGQAVHLNTAVIHCIDPRAVGIPAAVAREFGDVYPGEMVFDKDDQKVGSTVTLIPITNAGGRAGGALPSLAVLHYLFGLKNIVVVHHSFCGATSLTRDGLLEAYKKEQHQDISGVFPMKGGPISSFVDSLHEDVELLRRSPVVPQGVEVYGYFYEINSDELTQVVGPQAVKSKTA